METSFRSRLVLWSDAGARPRPSTQPHLSAMSNTIESGQIVKTFSSPSFFGLARVLTSNLADRTGENEVRLNPRRFRGVGSVVGGGREGRASTRLGHLGGDRTGVGERAQQLQQLESTSRTGREPDMGSGLHGGKGSIRVRDRSKQLRSELSESHSISPHPT